MSSGKMKDLRRQIENVVKTTFPEIFTKEAQKEMLVQLEPMVVQALAGIEKHVSANMTAHQEQTRVLENKMLQAASDHLNDMNVTMLAWQELVAEKLQLEKLVGKDFLDELESRKSLIRDTLKLSK